LKWKVHKRLWQLEGKKGEGTEEGEEVRGTRRRRRRSGRMRRRGRIGFGIQKMMLNCSI
jgi:hypothetical protein